MSSGFAFALAASSAMKDTASAGSGILTLASPPEEGAPAGAAPGRAAPAPGPGRGPAGARIRVQTVRPAARNSVSTAEPAVVSCQRLAAEADAWPANGAPHAVQNLAPATAFVPHWAQKRTDIGRRAILTETSRAAQPRQIGGGHHHNWRQIVSADLQRGSGFPLREPAYDLLCLAATHVRGRPNTSRGGRLGEAVRRRARARADGPGGDRGGHRRRRPGRPPARRRLRRAARARPS